eukprot:6270219-Amphidinium_carterae.1
MDDVQAPGSALRCSEAAVTPATCSLVHATAKAYVIASDLSIYICADDDDDDDDDEAYYAGGKILKIWSNSTFTSARRSFQHAVSSSDHASAWTYGMHCDSAG